MDEADTGAAVEAAKRAKVTTAEWLTLAIREKIARERVEVGEVMLPQPEPPPQTPMPSMSSLELIQSLEAYARVMEMRGKPISPKGKVLVGAERLLRARLLLTAPIAPPRRRRDAAANRPDTPPRQGRELNRLDPITAE